MKSSRQSEGSLLGLFSLFFLALSLIFLALAPDYPGFWIASLFLALCLLLWRGPKAIIRDLTGLAHPAKKKILRTAGSIALVVVLLLLTGSFAFLPILNVGAPPQAVLPEETKRLLEKLDRPVVMEARVGRQSSLGQISHLMDLYSRASSRVAASVKQAEGLSEVDDGEVRVARTDALLIVADGFSETISPVTVSEIDASLRRLISPSRFVYNLMGDGEKSVADESPMGLSLWASSLSASKIYLEDIYFPGPGLPPQAQAANALVLAGPRRPLGPERATALMDYVEHGGKLLILQDPLVSGLDNSALSRIGLSMPRGLTIDPETAWVGTEDRFIVGRDFPAHPITVGLSQPVVWPLVGALTLSRASAEEDLAEPVLILREDDDVKDVEDDLAASVGLAEPAEPPEPPGDEPALGSESFSTTAERPQEPSEDFPEAASAVAAAEAEMSGEESSPDDSDRQASITFKPRAQTRTTERSAPAAAESAESAASTSAEAASAEEETTDSPYHTWAIALSSPASWLETDAESIARGDQSYQPGEDRSGPLVLASATTLQSGGRLALLADADLAANGFVTYAGNLDFLNRSLFWLLGAQDDLAPASSGGAVLDIDHRRARLLFWLPSVIWPLLAVAVWLAFYRRRRRRED
ncbi:MAG: GldG family protein [Deltaproteobacteria bacterium]|nr:GldG family protein [Deltaproteobacteria bacterium]